MHRHYSHRNEFNAIFFWSITLNTAFIIAELLAGYFYNSLSLISDAWHNISDVLSLFIALIAIKSINFKKYDKTTKTYGYKKISILAALLNSLILLIAISSIIIKSYERLWNTPKINANGIIWVALMGIAINSISAWMFFKNKNKDINIKSAFMHLLSDALVSLGVVLTGIIIKFSGWYIIDPIMSFIIAAIIFVGTWNLLKESFMLSIDAVPKKINYEQIIQKLKQIQHIKDIHHVHIWPISTETTAFTAHFVIDKNVSLKELEKIKQQIKKLLKQINIQHSTIEFEFDPNNCSDKEC